MGFAAGAFLRDAAESMRSQAGLAWHPNVADFLEYAADFSDRLRGGCPPTVGCAMAIARAYLSEQAS